MKIDKVIKTLSHISSEGMDNPNLANLIEVEDVALPLAFAVEYGFATLTDKGEAELRKAYDYLAEVAGERGIKNLYNLVDVTTPIKPRKMTISINANGDFV